MFASNIEILEKKYFDKIQVIFSVCVTNTN